MHHRLSLLTLILLTGVASPLVAGTRDRVPTVALTLSKKPVMEHARPTNRTPSPAVYSPTTRSAASTVQTPQLAKFPPRSHSKQSPPTHKTAPPSSSPSTPTLAIGLYKNTVARRREAMHNTLQALARSAAQRPVRRHRQLTKQEPSVNAMAADKAECNDTWSTVSTPGTASEIDVVASENSSQAPDSASECTGDTPPGEESDIQRDDSSACEDSDQRVVHDQNEDLEQPVTDLITLCISYASRPSWVNSEQWITQNGQHARAVVEKLRMPVAQSSLTGELLPANTLAALHTNLAQLLENKDHTPLFNFTRTLKTTLPETFARNQWEALEELALIISSKIEQGVCPSSSPFVQPIVQALTNAFAPHLSVQQKGLTLAERAAVASHAYGRLKEYIDDLSGRVEACAENAHPIAAYEIDTLKPHVTLSPPEKERMVSAFKQHVRLLCQNLASSKSAPPAPIDDQLVDGITELWHAHLGEPAPIAWEASVPHLNTLCTKFTNELLTRMRRRIATLRQWAHARTSQPPSTHIAEQALSRDGLEELDRQIRTVVSLDFEKHIRRCSEEELATEYANHVPKVLADGLETYITMPRAIDPQDAVQVTHYMLEYLDKQAGLANQETQPCLLRTYKKLTSPVALASDPHLRQSIQERLGKKTELAQLFKNQVTRIAQAVNSTPAKRESSDSTPAYNDGTTQLLTVHPMESSMRDVIMEACSVQRVMGLLRYDATYLGHWIGERYIPACIPSGFSLIAQPVPLTSPIPESDPDTLHALIHLRGCVLEIPQKSIGQDDEEAPSTDWNTLEGWVRTHATKEFSEKEDFLAAHRSQCHSEVTKALHAMVNTSVEQSTERRQRIVDRERKLALEAIRGALQPLLTPSKGTPIGESPIEGIPPQLVTSRVIISRLPNTEA